VLEIVSGNAGVQCRCANGHVEQASVLVGADGAYSAVRQNLFRKLREKNLLPKSDTEALKFTQNCIIGVTKTIEDLDRFPVAGSEFAEVNIVVGKDQPYTLWLSPTFSNRIAWSVSGKLLTPEGSELSENFKQSEFGPEAVDAVCALIQDIPIPWGGTVADLIELTPREYVTKVMVEEKVNQGELSLIRCSPDLCWSNHEPDSFFLAIIALQDMAPRTDSLDWRRYNSPHCSPLDVILQTK